MTKKKLKREIKRHKKALFKLKFLDFYTQTFLELCLVRTQPKFPVIQEAMDMAREHIQKHIDTLKKELK